MYKQEWLFRGPTLDELTDLIHDERKGKNSALIVMPSYRGKQKLEKHIKLLEEQSFGNFDLAIIYGPGDEFIKNSSLSIAHLRRNENYGSAGGFYTGERFAIEQNYDYLIMADDDCFPADKNLVETIVSRLKEKEAVVLPTADVGDQNFIKHLMGFYAGMRVSTLRKAGLSWMPFFYYCEDLEWHNRLNIYAPTIIIPNKVVHETRQIYFFSDRAYYVIRNSLLLELMTGKKWVFFSYLFSFMFAGFSFYVLDRKRAYYLLDGIRDFIFLKMFKANPPSNFYMPSGDIPSDTIEITYETKQGIIKNLPELIGAFNKKITTKKANFTGIWPVFLYFWTGEFFVTDNKKALLQSARTGVFNKLTYLILLPLLVLMCAFSSMIIFLYAQLFIPHRSEKNLEYGVPKN